jgi:hypothetical protein
MLCPHRGDTLYRTRCVPLIPFQDLITNKEPFSSVLPKARCLYFSIRDLNLYSSCKMGNGNSFYRLSRSEALPYYIDDYGDRTREL